MMDAGTALLGIILGAILGGAGKNFFDYYQRDQERKSIAAAVAAEITAVLTSAEMKQMPQYFRARSLTTKPDATSTALDIL
jgi:hypothetical protein